MQRRATKLLVLPLLPLSIVGYCARAASPRSLMVNEVVTANPPLGNFAVSFEQLCSTCSTQAGMTSGLPKSFSELLSASENVSIPITDDRGDTEATVLLSILATIIPPFDLMALPIDQRYMYRMSADSHKKVQAVGSQVLNIP